MARRYPSYKDEPGVMYHYPKEKYHDRIGELLGTLVLVYEPRRGGTAVNSPGGGRSAFIGIATLGRRWDDPNDDTHAFVETLNYCEFPTIVPVSKSGVSGPSLESVVLKVRREIGEAIIRSGFDVVLTETTAPRQGLVDTAHPPLSEERRVVQVVSNRAVRDASFRFRVIEQVYDGRCALTGLRLTNGNGRAEVDAAHIRAVTAGGPDSVRNGLSLSKTMHWAFDRGLVSLSDDGQILTVENGIDGPIRKMLNAGGHALQPANPHERPHPAFLRWHREHVFKGSAS